VTNDTNNKYTPLCVHNDHRGDFYIGENGENQCNTGGRLVTTESECLDAFNHFKLQPSISGRSFFGQLGQDSAEDRPNCYAIDQMMKFQDGRASPANDIAPICTTRLALEPPSYVFKYDNDNGPCPVGYTEADNFEQCKATAATFNYDFEIVYYRASNARPQCYRKMYGSIFKMYWNTASTFGVSDDFRPLCVQDSNYTAAADPIYGPDGMKVGTEGTVDDCGDSNYIAVTTKEHCEHMATLLGTTSSSFSEGDNSGRPACYINQDNTGIRWNTNNNYGGNSYFPPVCALKSNTPPSPPPPPPSSPPSPPLPSPPPYSPPSPPTLYKFGEAWTVDDCGDVNYMAVTSETLCNHIAGELGLGFNADNQNYGPPCSIQNGGNTVLWNNPSTVQANWDKRPVCSMISNTPPSPPPSVYQMASSHSCPTGYTAVDNFEQCNASATHVNYVYYNWKPRCYTNNNAVFWNTAPSLSQSHNHWPVCTLDGNYNASQADLPTYGPDGIKAGISNTLDDCNDPEYVAVISFVDCLHVANQLGLPMKTSSSQNGPACYVDHWNYGCSDGVCMNGGVLWNTGSVTSQHNKPPVCVSSVLNITQADCNAVTTDDDCWIEGNDGWGEIKADTELSCDDGTVFHRSEYNGNYYCAECSWICDGQPDCPDGSDEIGCPDPE